MTETTTNVDRARLRKWFTETTNWYGPPVLALLDALTQAEAKSAMSMASEAAAWSQRDEAVNLATLLRDERDASESERKALQAGIQAALAACTRAEDDPPRDGEWLVETDVIRAALAGDGRDDPEDIAEAREWARSRRDAQRRAQETTSE